MSRALGDFKLKKNKDLPPEKQIITADPEITRHEITSEDEFIVLACNGIWDCLSSNQVTELIRHLISLDKPLRDIPEAIFGLCLRPKSPLMDEEEGPVFTVGHDNMTMIIVALLHGRTEEEWHAWVKSRVDKSSEYTMPQLYPEAMTKAFAKRRAWDEEDRRKGGRGEQPATNFIVMVQEGTY
jgi:protein phosphatase PTC2/3